MQDDTAKLSNFLSNKLNIQIYEELERHYPHIDALQFFENVNIDLSFFSENYDDYLLISHYFKKCKYSGRDRYFYLYSLIRLIESKFDDDELSEGVLSKSFRLLNRDWNAEYEKIPREPSTVEDGFGYWFSDVKKHLESVNDVNEKKKLLIKLKYDCLQITQAVGKLAPRNYHTFPKDCDLELKKIAELEAIGEQKEIPKPKLDLRQIALIHVYNDKQITDGDVANRVASAYGMNSGRKLYQYYSFYSSRTNRIKFKEAATDVNSIQKKIELFESLTPLLGDNEDAKKRLVAELEELKKALF